MIRAGAFLVLAVAVLLFAGCGVSGGGMDLFASGVAGRAVAHDAQGRHFTDAAGREITLFSAVVTFTSIEVFPCATVGLRDVLRWLSPIGTAHAHGVNTSTRMGVPALLELDAEDDGARTWLGGLRPPNGSYCTARVVFGPTESDTAGAAARNMVGKTLLISGTADGRPFSLESSDTLGADVVLQDLSLEGMTHAGRAFTVAYGSWFDGVDLDAPDAAHQVLQRISANVSAQP